MMSFLKKLLGIADPVDYAGLLANGATIVDVRTPGEFYDGHANGAVNIPLNVLQQNLNRIDKKKAVIVCCASGMRSSSARRLLREQGFSEVYDAGSWRTLKNHSK